MSTFPEVTSPIAEEISGLLRTPRRKSRVGAEDCGSMDRGDPADPIQPRPMSEGSGPRRSVSS
jgi:hypothetical protein